MSETVAALLPLAVLCLLFLAWCLLDLSRHEVKHLPRWAWVVIVVASIPTGGIVYLLVGRGEELSRS